MSVSMDNQQNIAKLKNIPDCDILVLCEMWNCPYHNDALKTAYLRHDESLMALKKLAKSHRIRHGENVAFYYVTTFAFQKYPEFYLKMEHKFYFVQPPLMSRLQRNIGSYLLKHAP